MKYVHLLTLSNKVVIVYDFPLFLYLSDLSVHALIFVNIRRMLENETRDLGSLWHVSYTFKKQD